MLNYELGIPIEGEKCVSGDHGGDGWRRGDAGRLMGAFVFVKISRRQIPPFDRWEEPHGLEAHATHGQDGRATKEALAHAVGTIPKAFGLEAATRS